MKPALCAALAAMLRACASPAKHALPPRVEASLALKAVDPAAARFEVAFKEGGKPAGSAVFEKGEDFSRTISVTRGARS